MFLVTLREILNTRHKRNISIKFVPGFCFLTNAIAAASLRRFGQGLMVHSNDSAFHGTTSTLSGVGNLP